MRRLHTVLCGIAVTAAGFGAAAVSTPALAGATGAPPPSAAASLTRIACHSSLQPTLNRVSVVSMMGHLPGTRLMSVRISLLERAGGAPARTVVGGDLGRWVYPATRSLGQDPGDVWRLAKVVSDVDAPASYRFVVDFRWQGPRGAVIARRTLRTGSCSVRQLRPDVLVRGVTVTPLRTGTRHDRYVVQIASRGATATGPFTVLLSERGGLASQTVAVPSLAAHARTVVRFTGPACDAAQPLTVVADPTDQVDDYDRANNTFPVVCPAD